MGAKCVSRSRTNNKPETTHEVKTFTHPRLIELEVKTQELDDFFDSFEMYVEINTPNATPREIRAVPKTYKKRSRSCSFDFDESIPSSLSSSPESPVPIAQPVRLPHEEPGENNKFYWQS